MRTTAVLVFALFAVLLPASGVEWTLLKHDGREYVSFENMAEFYGLSAVQRTGSAGMMMLGNRSLRGEQGSPDFFINNLKFILSYPVAEIEGHLCVSRVDLVKMIEPVLRPSRIKNPGAVDTIVLDPGHGGHDLGAPGGAGGREKDFTLDTCNRARLRLMQAGFTVYQTRTTDTFIPLEDRVAFANQYPNALFISVHYNSSAAGTGIETYTLAPRGVPSMMADGARVSDSLECRGNCRDAENIALATATHAALVVRSHMNDRGIKRARFVVIRDIAIPGVLIEGGFLSNPYDSRMIATGAYREQIAACIVEAALNYRRAVAGPEAPKLVARPDIKLPELTPLEAKLAPIAEQRPVKAPAPEPKRNGTLSTDAAVAASAAKVSFTPN